MACVRKGSLVEMIDSGDNVWFQEVETLSAGDTVRDPVTGRASTVFTTISQEMGGMWPLVQYMGLTSDLAQYVHVPGREWVMAGDVGTRSLQICPHIYAIVLLNGNMARVDGVTCCVHAPVYRSIADTATQVGPLFFQ